MSPQNKESNNLKNLDVIAVTPQMSEQEILKLMLENFKRQGIKIKGSD